MKLKLKDYRLLVLLLMISSSIFSQFKVTGIVTSEENKPLNKVEIFNSNGGVLAKSGN